MPLGLLDLPNEVILAILRRVPFIPCFTRFLSIINSISKLSASLDSVRLVSKQLLELSRCMESVKFSSKNTHLATALDASSVRTIYTATLFDNLALFSNLTKLVVLNAQLVINPTDTPLFPNLRHLDLTDTAITSFHGLCNLPLLHVLLLANAELGSVAKQELSRYLQSENSLREYSGKFTRGYPSSPSLISLSYCTCFPR